MCACIVIHFVANFVQQLYIYVRKRETKREGERGRETGKPILKCVCIAKEKNRKVESFYMPIHKIYMKTTVIKPCSK